MAVNQVCTKCGIEKPLSNFYFRNDKGYHKKQCIECTLEMDKINREKNKEKIKIRVKNHSQKPEVKNMRKEYMKDYKLKNKEIIKEKNKKYRQDNREKIKEYHKKHYEENREKLLLQGKKRLSKNKERRKEYNKNYRKKRLNNDAEYKIKSYMLSHFTRELKKRNIDKKDKMFKMTGYKYSDYINHLKKDKLWVEYNNNNGIHIDHIIPLSQYDLKNIEEIKKCWNPENLRLLPSSENQSKGNNIDFDLIKKHNIEHLLPEGLKNELEIY